jgi:hypothetical protein
LDHFATNTGKETLTNVTITDDQGVSVHLVATELDVLSGMVNCFVSIYAPKAQSANSVGFTNDNTLMAETVTELGPHLKSGYRNFQ